MGSGDYINKLVQGVRGELASDESQDVVPSEPLENESGAKEESDINSLLESMRKFKVKGDAKRLIRMDSRTEKVLKLLNPTFRVDVTSFVNFLCWEFLKENPGLIKEIKQSHRKIKL
jgi:hypothetical protein